MKSGDLTSYLEMCSEEEVNLQRGMNYHFHRDTSVILVSLRPNAPYADRVEDNIQLLCVRHNLEKHDKIE